MGHFSLDTLLLLLQEARLLSRVKSGSSAAALHKRWVFLQGGVPKS